MTYRESYLKCKTLKELMEEVNSDIAIAIAMLSVDRLKVIEQEATKVANEKFNNEKFEKQIAKIINNGGKI